MCAIKQKIDNTTFHIYFIIIKNYIFKQIHSKNTLYMYLCMCILYK